MKNTVAIRRSQSDIVTRTSTPQRVHTLERHRIVLPDLSASIDPKSPQFATIVEALNRFDAERGGLAPRTLKTLCSVINVWDKFCRERQLYAFPISEAVALSFFQHQRYDNNRSIATLNQYRSQLSYLLKYMCIDNVLHSQTIKDFFKPLRRDHVELTQTAYHQNQAFGLRGEDLKFIIERYNVTELKSLRDLAFICMAYGTALRESELCRIQLKHIVTLSNGDLRIMRTQSKTSSSAPTKSLFGVLAGIVRLFINQLENHFGGLTPDSYLFARLVVADDSVAAYRMIDHTPMSASTVASIFQRMYKFAKRNGITFASPNPHVWSAHSARVGAVQTAFINGRTDAELRQIGDWTSNSMVQRYIRALEITDAERSHQSDFIL